MMKTVLLCLGILDMLGCASQTKLPGPAQAAIASKNVGRIVELRQSCYYGELYDENTLWLLSPYPFPQTSHIDDLNGNPIHPQVQLGLIPAGTKVVIDRIEFPNNWAMAKRMLTTPRYNAWVYLRAAPDDPHVPMGAKPFIWVLPLDLDTEELVEAALAKILAPDNEMSGWLASRRASVQAAITNKSAVAGMSMKELVTAMGDPLHWFVDSKDNQNINVAWFPESEAWIRDDIVVEVRPSRAVHEKVGKAGG